MKRNEAKIGMPVVCETILNGSYIGELAEIVEISRQPWRGMVKIKAVTTFPECYGNSGYFLVRRRPYEYDSIHEFGGKYIKPYNGEIPDYRRSLLTALEKAIGEEKAVIEASPPDKIAEVDRQILEYLLQYYERVKNGVAES